MLRHLQPYTPTHLHTYTPRHLDTYTPTHPTNQDNHLDPNHDTTFKAHLETI
ncbi:MAG: hypothetical protein SNJ09_07020 [Rikenellaceae bacterium]